MLSEAIWRQIRKTLPSTSKGFIVAFSYLTSFLPFSFFLSLCFAFSLSPFSVTWTTWTLSLILRDLTSDFKLRLFQLLIFSTQQLLLPLHTYTVNRQEVKTTTSLSIFCKKNTNNKQSIRIRHSTPWSNAMAIFFFCVSDMLYTQEGKKWRFPFGKELTTCWRLFKWRGGLACATVNKLKCWEVQWVNCALSKAAPTWHTAFDVLAKFVFWTTTSLTQSVVHKLTHPLKKTHRHTQKQCVIWTDACHAVTLAQLVCVRSHNTQYRCKHTLLRPAQSRYGCCIPFSPINQHYSQSGLFCHPWPGRQRHWHLNWVFFHGATSLCCTFSI